MGVLLSNQFYTRRLGMVGIAPGTPFRFPNADMLW
jgi:hypothetical protein